MTGLTKSALLVGLRRQVRAKDATAKQRAKAIAQLMELDAQIGQQIADKFTTKTNKLRRLLKTEPAA